jgi:hypothetical protein
VLGWGGRIAAKTLEGKVENTTTPTTRELFVFTQRAYRRVRAAFHDAPGGFSYATQGWNATLPSERVRGIEPRLRLVAFGRENRSGIGTEHFTRSRLRDQPFVILQRVDVDLAL